MVSRVSERLGFQADLSPSTVESMYRACAFEKAWNVTEPSKWCTAFTEEDLQVLEYIGDLNHYYEAGYGREYSNKQLGCPMLNDLYVRLNNTVSGGLESDVDRWSRWDRTQDLAKNEYILMNIRDKSKITFKLDWERYITR